MHSPFRSFYQGDSGIVVSDQNPPSPSHEPYTAVEGDVASKYVSFGMSPILVDGAYVEFELLNSDVQRIYEYQQKNSKFNDMNAVLCSGPISYCESYILLNKSIIWYIGSQRLVI